MTKTELIDAIAEETQRPKVEADIFLKAFTDIVMSELARGGDCRLYGFGVFEVADRAATSGRNPRTGEAIQIAAKRVARFRPSKALTEALNPPVPALRRRRA